jgi:hypothetical protein
MLVTIRARPVSMRREAFGRFFVAVPPERDLLFCAKHLFIAAMAAIASAGGSRMSTSSVPKSEQDLPSIPMAQGAFPAWLSPASKAPACRWHPFLGVWD